MLEESKVNRYPLLLIGMMEFYGCQRDVQNNNRSQYSVLLLVQRKPAAN